MHSHAAAAGRALDEEGVEDLLLDRGYGIPTLRIPYPGRAK